MICKLSMPPCICFRRRMSWLTPSLARERSSSDKVLREGHAQLVRGSDRLLPCLITLTQEDFVFSVNGTHELSLSWRYIYGCHCLRGRQGKSKNVYFCIYVYPPTKKKKLGAICHRQVITFSVDDHNCFSDNMELAKTWQTIILDCIAQSVPAALRIPNAHLPYLVFLNRKSGAGHAFTIFEKNINPVFGEADVPYKLMLTERANHAREMVRSSDLSQYRGIVVVSGDGLIYEVLNGLFERDDWQDVVPKTPIGVVAGGSGNGLASALCYASGLSMIENIHMHNALMLAKPMLQKMDIVRVQTTKESLVSFLSITWAMIADIDIQSERLRSLGGARFTVAAFAKILGARTYRGTIAFLPAESYDPDARLPVQRRRATSSVGTGPIPVARPRHSLATTDLDNRWQRKSGTDVFTSQSYSAPKRMHRSVTLPSNGRSEFPNEIEDDEYLDDVDRRPRPGLCFSGISEHTDNNVFSASSDRSMEGSRLPPLDESIPEGWVSITDDFLIFLATYQTHISTDAFIMPHATMDDGLIHLMLIRTGASRSVVFNILTSLEEGQHVNNPHIEMISCHAFRLIPHTPDGIISVDGERVDYGPIQAEIHSQRVSVITNCSDVKHADPSSNVVTVQPRANHNGPSGETTLNTQMEINSVIKSNGTVVDQRRDSKITPVGSNSDRVDEVDCANNVANGSIGGDNVGHLNGCIDQRSDEDIAIEHEESGGHTDEAINFPLEIDEMDSLNSHHTHEQFTDNSKKSVIDSTGNLCEQSTHSNEMKTDVDYTDRL